MIQSVATPSSSAPIAAIDRPLPRVWGLSARELHDAFWHARGVQCIRRGHRVPLQRGVELFLLIEPDQLVTFNLADFTERLTWHNAKVTRVRLTDESPEGYSERVIVDEKGFVEKIERRYRAKLSASHRVAVTPSRRIAGLWMNATRRHDAWDRVRRSVAWARVDHRKCPGKAFLEGDRTHESRLLTEIVERWPQPDQAIVGIEQILPGVWALAGSSAPVDKVLIGPLWIGSGKWEDPRRCVVGPTWTEDERNAGPAPGTVAVREIAEVELAEPTRTVKPVKRGLYPLAKRLFDITMSLGALVVLFPLMAVVAVLILLEDGQPIFFGHVRQSRGGRDFKCWKFRTMVPGAQSMARTLDSNQCDGPQVYDPNDPRRTRVGKILRKVHLDELPQFWNVLVGEMSIVGPRPSPEDENQFCPAWRDLRLSVRPGITGLWQLLRTRETGRDFEEWIKYDIEYVRRANFWFDLEIILRTAQVLFLGRKPHEAK